MRGIPACMRGSAVALVCVLGLLAPGRATAETTVFWPRSCAPLGDAPGDDQLLACFAPIWVVDGTEKPYNRIGRPELHRTWSGSLRAGIDPDHAHQYAEVRRETLGGREILQLVYRVQFEKVPLRFSPFFFEAHDHAGLLALLTLDAETREVWFVTLVHACGCYLAILPTDRLPADVLPADWPETQQVYGHALPGIARAPRDNSRAMIWLEADSHRVIAMRPRRPPAGPRTELILRPMAKLRDLPIQGDEDGGTGSFFYTRGPLRGHVRGAWNPWEGLTLGIPALDPTVGMDKDFGAPEETGTPFYTSLRFWRHDASRLDRFERLLRQRGFRTDLLSP